MYQGKGRAVDFERAIEGREYFTPPQSGKALGRKLPHGATICAMGLALPSSLELDQWKDIGITLCTIDRAVQWAIGDWWAYGHHTYGERAAIAAKELPYTFGSLMNLGTVARCVSPSFRNEALSFSHHVQVAPLEPEEQKVLLARAVEFEWSVSMLRELVQSRRARRLEELLLSGLEGPSEARKWLASFLDRARRAELACTWPHVAEPVYLDDLEEGFVADLVEAGSKAAEAWSQFTVSLKEYQQKRAAAGSSAQIN